MNVKQLKTIKTKRNEEKVPGFDEIIFENRNKEYGAYDLRKRYNSVKSLSIFGAIAFCIIPLTVIFLTAEKGTATSGPVTFVIIEPDVYTPEIIKQPEIKMPPELVTHFSPYWQILLPIR